MKKVYSYNMTQTHFKWQQVYPSLRFIFICMALYLLANTNAVAKSAFVNPSTANTIRLEINTSKTGNILDCAVTEVLMESQIYVDETLTKEGFSYSWTGPASFEANTQDVVVTVPGWYRLTVSNADGLTTSKEYIVYGPGFPDDYAGPDLTMYSTDTSIKLQGKAYNFYHVTWEASDGGNIVSGANTYTPTVDAPGTYTIFLTSPAGCTMQDAMVVTEAEDVLVARIGDGNVPRIDCDSNPITLISFVTLNGKEVTEGITYSWTGPNDYVSDARHASVKEPGEYRLEVKHIASGLTSSATIGVTQLRFPEGSAGPDKVLTCNNPTVTLEGSITNDFGWPIWLAGDGGNIVSGYRTLNPVVDAPGTYTLILQHAKGFPIEYTVKVTRDEGPSISATGGRLDCASGSVQLTGSSDREGVTYSWTGPNGYTSTEQNPTVKVAGDYTLTVTDPETGCSASTMVAVTQSSSELTAKEYLIDFNSEKNGLISSIETDAGPVSIMGRKRNPGSTETYASENHAAIFNTRAPTGDDTDLYTTDWGRVLIINTDLSDVPDDNQWGGELILDFSAIGPVTLQSLGLLDLDHYEDMSWVYMYDEAGNELHKIHLKTMGDNSKQTVDLGNTRGVTKLKVVLDGRDGSGNFAGSGAIDDIRFRVETEVTSPCENVQQQEAMQALAYPTTFSDKATVQFTMQDAGNYAVDLYDTQGNLVRELQKGTAMAHEQITIEVAAGSLKEGMYLVRIVSPINNKTLKLILKR